MKITRPQLRKIIQEAWSDRPKGNWDPPTEILTQLETALFAMTDWLRENGDPMGDLQSTDLETYIGAKLKDELGLFIQENLPESNEW